MCKKQKSICELGRKRANREISKSLMIYKYKFVKINETHFQKINLCQFLLCIVFFSQL